MTVFSHISSSSSDLTLSGCPEGFDALVASDLARREGLSVFIARDYARMNAVISALGFFAPDLEILQFPAWDCLPYDRMSPTPGIVAQRMYALSRLTAMKGKKPEKPRLLMTTVNAMAQKIPPRAVVSEGRLSLRPGQSQDIDKLEAYFQHQGYTRVSTVAERGEFAVRGGLLDVFPPSPE